MGFLKRWVEKWSMWIGDRDLELALRQRLNREGFYGDGARFENLKLAAIERPGWLQVYVFTAVAKSRLIEDAQPQQIFGVLRQDERYNKLDVQVFASRPARNAKFQEWSQELIRVRNASL